jgi:hypothetical protein
VYFFFINSDQNQRGLGQAFINEEDINHRRRRMVSSRVQYTSLPSTTYLLARSVAAAAYSCLPYLLLDLPDRDDDDEERRQRDGYTSDLVSLFAFVVLRYQAS